MQRGVVHCIKKGGQWTGTDLINSVLVCGDVKLKFELDGGKFLIVTTR